MKVAYNGRKAILAIAGAVTLIVLGLALFQISRARCSSLVGDAICRVETSRPLVALTFDDGPTDQGVEIASRVLRDNGARGTFFLIGHEASDREHLVRRLLAEGHEVGNHSFSHTRMVLRWPHFYDDEIERTDRVLRKAGVPEPDLFRPPYGKKLIGLPMAVERHGYRMIMWDVEDPPGATNARDYADRIVQAARPGSIILMHIMYPANEMAREALPTIVKGLQAKGFDLVTVSELLHQQPAPHR